jgi:gentisate 1,2-dioxygenase
MGGKSASAPEKGSLEGLAIEDDLTRLDEEIAQYNLEGHWKLVGSLPPEPQPFAKPYLWRWQDIRRLLWRAGEMRGIEGGASRRTVRLCTPGHDLKWTTPTIHASVQLVKPGEIAEAHRHSMGAFRFVLEGRGGYTTVEGEKFVMEPGDLILTPGWAYHDHGHEGDIPTIWIDVHDFPFTNHLRSLFYQPYGRLQQPLRNNLPDSSPFMFKGRDALAALQASGDNAHDPTVGVTYDYRGPSGAASTLPTMACRLHRLSAGEMTDRARETANRIFHVVSGRGRTCADNLTLDWQQGDIFVMPGWTWHDHQCAGDEDAVLFSVSDEPILKQFGLMRRETAAR